MPHPPTDLLQALSTWAPGPEARRVFHGRGGAHPGREAWTLDWYPPVAVLIHHGAAAGPDQAPAAPAPAAQEPEGLSDWQLALAEHWQAQSAAPAQLGPLNLLLQQRDGVRAHHTLLAGEVPDTGVVQEAGARYQVQLGRGLNSGLFLDMAEGRRWVRHWASEHPQGRLLNLFAHTCSFSVAALLGGAASVCNLDMAAGALAIGKRNHALNGLDDARARFWPHDLFSSWGKVTREGPYDLVIADPPSYQKGSFVAEKDWARLLRRLPDLLAPGGQAMLCLNSPKLGPDWLLDLAAAEAPALRWQQRLPNPAVMADADERRSLKVMLFDLNPTR